MSAEEEASSAPKVTLRAETTGLGALLASLRGDNMHAELHQLSTQSQSSESEGVEEEEKIEKPEKMEKLEVEKVEEPARPMNRKEKRRLQRLKELETGEISVKKKVIEVVEVAKIPKKLEKIFCDTATFSSYSAKFGYSATRTNNFVHFSHQNPTGTHAIVGSQDRYIRVYGLENEVAVQWKHNTGNLVLDACWEASGKGVFSTSKLRPIQLFETETGTILGAYNGKDTGDNITEAMCVGQAGNTLIGGYRNQFQLWDIEYTGDAMTKMRTFDKTYNSGFNGIAMSIDCHPTMPDIFAAAGTSSVLATFSMKWKNAVSTIEGSARGYTNVRFSTDGMKLYASERCGDIHCFDTRMNMMVQVLKRDMTTNHRTRFDIDPSGRLLYSGTSSGDVVIYDLHDFNEELQPIIRENVASSCVPCVSVRKNRMVVCTGQRHFPDDPVILRDEDDGMEEEESKIHFENSVQILNILDEIQIENDIVIQEEAMEVA